MNIKPLFNKKEKITLNEYLRRCGIDAPESYINPSATAIEPISHYNSIEECISLLSVAIGTNKKIVIVCDSDCDGYCSSAIAYQFLVAQGVPKERIVVLFHESKRHGLSKNIMGQLDKLNLDNVCLVWLPDAGTNDVEQCAFLNHLGVRVLITDHHKAERKNEWAVIVNNQISDNVNNKHLCGTGVTHKLISEYCKRNNGAFHRKVIDLVALATIGDVMDMREVENRMIAKWGLEHITNPFLRAMCAEFISGDDITPTALAWSIVPKFNAICRGSNQKIKEDVFNALVGNTTQSFEDVISAIKAEYKQQKQTVSELYNQALDIKPIGNKVKIFEFENTPYTGLIATKLSEHFASPCIVVHRHSNGTFNGSLRSPYELKTKLSESGLMTLCMGHECACGTGWKIDDTDKLSAYCEQLDLGVGEKEVMLSTNDMLIDYNVFTIVDEGKNLWGQGVPEPTIHISDITINGLDIKELGRSKTTIKFLYGDTECIAFFVNKKEKEALHVGENVNIKLEIIGTPTINTWRNKETKQIIMKDWEVCINKNEKIGQN